MGDGRTVVVSLREARAMSEQNLLVSAGSAPAPNRFPSKREEELPQRPVTVL
jgi:hypothetical protein